MKKALTLLAPALILILSFLLIVQHIGPQPQLITDMVTPQQQHTISPPAGLVPFGNTRPPQAAEHLFRNNCAACHGASGNGQSYVANYPGMPAVGNLTTINKTPEELLHSLLHGRGAMPGFRNTLNQTEAKSLIQHIITHLQQQ